MSVAVGIMQLAGLASIGAGAIHAGRRRACTPSTPTLARLFVAVAVAQIGVGLLALVKGGRLAAIGPSSSTSVPSPLGCARLWGISWIDGLGRPRTRSSPTPPARCSARSPSSPHRRPRCGRTAVSTVRLGVPAFAVGLVTLAAMLVGADHSHSHAPSRRRRLGAGAPVAADDHAHSHGDEAPSGAEARPPLRPTGRGRSTRRSRSTSAASTASPLNSSCGRRPSSRTPWESCRRSPTSTRSTRSATARSATPAPATSTTSTTR